MTSVHHEATDELSGSLGRLAPQQRVAGQLSTNGLVHFLIGGYGSKKASKAASLGSGGLSDIT